ncbi:MAG: Ig-like domain repeat protein, partial [Terracidiphilus sp.]
MRCFNCLVFLRPSIRKTICFKPRTLPGSAFAACLALLGIFCLPDSLFAQVPTSTALAVTNSEGTAVASVSSGTVVALTASVTTTTGGSKVKLGTVIFCDATATYCEDEHLIGSAQVTSKGTAVFKFKPSPGSHIYQAFFLGTPHGTTHYSAGASGVENLTVTAGPFVTTTAIAQSGSVGEYVLTATVTSPNATLLSPTGTVDFLDTSNSNYFLGSGSLAAGPTKSSLGTFAPLYAGAQPQYVVVADMNQDGIPDLVVMDSPSGSNYTTNFFSVLLGNGDGTFQGATSYTSKATPSAIAVGDLNGDGYPDVVVSDATDQSIFVYLNDGNGDGGLNAPIGYAFPTYFGPYGVGAQVFPAGGLAIADLNGDGKLDVVATLSNFADPNTSCNGEDCSAIGVMLGNGDGTLQVTNTEPYMPVYNSGFQLNNYDASVPVVLADLRGIGILDAVITEEGFANVCVDLGNGDGTFQSPTCFPSGTGPILAVGDFTGNGIPDLVVNNSATGGLSVLLGAGDGTFPNAVSVVLANSATVVTTGDINGDGKLGLVAAGDDTITVIPGNGNGTFGPASTYTGASSGGLLYSVAAPDLKGDGVLDVVAIDGQNGSANVLLGSLSTSATASLSGVSLVGQSGGADAVEANYLGDSYFSESTSGTTSLTTQQVPTTIALASNVSTVTVGGLVTLTATISPDSAQNYIPSGTVTFSMNGNIIGTATPSNGVAVLRPSLTVVQTDSFTASYSGDSIFSAPLTASPAVQVTVQQAATSLTLSVCVFSTTWTCPATTGTHSEVIELTATLTPNSVAGGQSTNGETVTFYNNGTSIGAATLTDGYATIDLAQPAAGSYSFTASYGGDATFIAGSTTSPALMTVQKLASSMSLTSNPPSPSQFGASVTLQASFQTYPYNASGETVTFYNGAHMLGAATLIGNNPIANLTLNNLPVGNYSFTVSYPGDANFDASTSPATSFSVQKLPTVITMGAGAGASIYGETILLQADLEPYNVTGPGGATTNNELVTFYNNGVSVGTTTLTNGAATLTINSPPVGNNLITASYAGDANFAGSTTSQGADLLVQKASTTMGLITSAPQGNIGSGQPVTLTATLAPFTETGGVGTNGETITFLSSGNPIGTGTLTNGVATLLISGLTEGNYSFTASYSGDASFSGSSAAATGLMVLQSTSLALTVNPTQFATPIQPITVTATLSPYVVGTNSTNGEPVALYNGASAISEGTLSNGVATFTFPSGVPLGSYSFTAVYNGDSVLAGSTSAPIAYGVVTGQNFVVNTSADDSGTAAKCTPQGSITINSTDSACSLRDALVAAVSSPDGANITFDSTKFTAANLATNQILNWIILTNGTLTVPTNTTITGATAGSGSTLTNLVTVDGNGDSSQPSSTVFSVTGAGTSINNLTITGGFSASNGGGILNSGVLTLTNSSIEDNGTNSNGGGIYNTGTLTVVGSTLAANSAGLNGGAIDNENTGMLTVIYSTIADNTAQNAYAGGIFVGSGTSTIINSSIARNSLFVGSGGISNAGGTGTVTLANNIVSQNGSLTDIEGTYTDKGGNDIGLFNGSVINDPNFLALNILGNYGGPTETMLPVPGSSAICAGTYANSPSQWTSPLTPIAIDQRGYPNVNTAYYFLLPYSSVPEGCVDAGAVQTNYTSIQFQQSSYTGVAGGGIAPTVIASVTENGANRGPVPVTLHYSGPGDLSGNTGQTAEDVGVSFPGLSVDTAGSGTLSSTIVVVGTGQLNASANLTVLPALQITPGSETISAAIGVPFSQSFSVSNGSGSYQLANAGTLPPGLTLTPSATTTGTSWTLSGTPTANGSYNFTLTATDVTNSIVTLTQSYTFSVAPATTTSLAASPSSSASFGQTVTLTATVSSPTANGTVTFFDSGSVLGSAAVSLSGGSPNTASIALNASTLGSPLAIGAHSFTAQFSGDASDAASSSNTVPYTITVSSFVVNNTGDDNGTYTCTQLASTTSNTTDGNNGGNPGLCTLRDALNTASSAGPSNIYFDTTIFAASNLTGNPSANTIYPNLATTGSLSIPSNATIQGLTSGSGATLTNLVTVDGGGSSVAGNATIFVVSGTSAVINNLNIQNGYSSGGIDGGAISNTGSITVSGTTFTNNQATATGGAIFNAGGTLTVVNSTFYGNSTTGGSGGAIENSLDVADDSNCGTATITNSTFFQNSAANSGNARGGAINNEADGCTLTVINSTISGNSVDSAIFGGGGIWSWIVPVNMSNSIVTGNLNGSSNPDDFEDRGTGGSFWNGSSVINGNLIGVYNNQPQNGTNVTLSPLGNYGGPTQTMISLPGSVSICAGIAISATADQRGDPWQPTGGYCPSGTVDSGAVQSNYALSFTTEPPSSGFALVALSPAPVVTLTESGSVFAPATSTVTMTDLGGGLSASGVNSAALSSGSATFGNLIFSSVETSDTLSASLSLNPNLATPLNLVSPPSTAVNVAIGTPTITSVSAILPQQTQTIIINGSGFGTQAPYNGDTSSILFADPTGTAWYAGDTGNAVTLAVSSWTDSQIVLTGFTGKYGTDAMCIKPGDQLYVKVWNAQTGNGPAYYGVTAGSGTNTCDLVPTITSVSPILPQQTQTITISGYGFGTQAPYAGNSSRILFADPTGTPWYAGDTGDAVTLAVSSWTDSQIVITGFTGAYGSDGQCIKPSDQLYVKVWNAQTGSGPAYYPITAGSGTNTCVA